MHRTQQEIAAIDVFHVHLIGVVPADRPRVDESEPIAAVLEAWDPADHHRTIDAESVVTAKVGAETGVGNAAAASVTGVFGLLRGPRLLRAVLLLRVLCRLGSLRFLFLRGML